MYGQRTIWLLFLSAGLAVILVCFLVWQQPERKALRFFDKHRTELAQTAQDWIQSGKIQFGSGVIVNVWDGEHPVMEYLLGDYGMVSAEERVGFFFSPEDIPVPFQNRQIPLTQVEKQEWHWQDEANGEQGTVKKLEPCWYYFEASAA